MKMPWYYRLALKMTIESKHHHYRMAAVVFKGGSVLSSAPNSESIIHGSVPSGKHAEARALPPHRDFRGASICVAREGARISKPCASCMTKIRKAGLARIIYSDVNGSLREERV